MKITYIAQSGFILESKVGNIAIDLWLDNPLNSIKLSDIPTLSYIFVTHDHADHGLSDAMKLVKRDAAEFISSYDIQKWVQKEHGMEIKSPGNIGGMYKVGDIEVIQTHAEHSSDIGQPVGFIIKVDGKIIYHMGDTGYFTGLNAIGEMYDIDVLMVPIGSRYTMSAYEASFAVRDIKPKTIIPMHYDTFPGIKQDPGLLVKNMEKLGVEGDVRALKLGEILSC